MIKVTRKKNESFEAMARRFRRHTINRGVVREAKSKRFAVPDVSRNMRRTATITRMKMGAKMQYLRKIGKLVEPEPRRGRRR